jgi:hypothetical protein
MMKDHCAGMRTDGVKGIRCRVVAGDNRGTQARDGRVNRGFAEALWIRTPVRVNPADTPADVCLNLRIREQQAPAETHSETTRSWRTVQKILGDTAK